MGDDAYNTAWDWGESSYEYVGRFLEEECDGTFLVFHTGSLDNLYLAVRVNAANKFVKIYHQDDLYGFTEPLNFDTLEDALDAYNWSPTESGNTLIYPGIKPGTPLHRSRSRSSRASLNEVEPLLLLKRLRLAVNNLREKTVEYDAVKDENRQLEERVQDLNNSLDSVTCYVKLIEAQIKKHCDVFKRASIETKDASHAFSSNYKRLISRLSELSTEKSQVTEEKNAAEQEKGQVEKRLAVAHGEIQQIVNEKMTIRKVLLGRNPDFNVFLESLMDDGLLEYPSVKILNVDKSTAEKMLKSGSDGTFLVRNGHGDPDIPFILSLRFTKKVLHFPVLQIDGCVGLDQNTCIFENVHELVKHYSIVSFSVHEERYGNLTLSEQAS